MPVVTVTQHFKIAAATVDFVNVDVFEDNRLFLDPSAIRWQASQGDAWSVGAHKSLCDFFDELLGRLPSRGREMLIDFHEPNETRLGMSRRGTVRGRGAAKELGTRIWDEMRTNALCLLTVPVFRRLEHLPLFVEDIDKDLVSDIGTRILFEDLVKFTQQQMTKHPELGPGADVTIEWVWDKTVKRWGAKTYTLPHVRGGAGALKPLLLVPHRAVYSSLRMSARKYWSKAILDEVQDREAAVINGKLVKTPKDDLKARADLHYVRPASQTWTERTKQQTDRNLVEVYERYVDNKFVPMTYAEVLHRVQNP